MEATHQQVLSLQLLPNQSNDRDVVLAAVEQNGCALGHAASALQADRHVVCAALKNDAFACVFVAPEARDRMILLQALQRFIARIRRGRSELLDPGQVSDLVTQSVFLAESCMESLGADESLAGEVLRLASGLRELGAGFPTLRGFVAAQLEEPVFALAQREELRSSRTFVRAAVKEGLFWLQHASEELQQDRRLVLHSLKHDRFSLQHADQHLREDRRVVQQALVQNASLSLSMASDRLRADQRLVLAAIAQNFAAFEHAHAGLKSNKRFVLSAVTLACR